MKLATRILIALFAVVAAIAWCLVPVAVIQFANGLRGMSAGPVSGSTSIPLPRLLLIAGIWLTPMTAFVLMFLNAFNVLKGAVRCVAYWYALIFLVIAGGGLMVLFPLYYGFVKWIGLAFLLIAMLWGYVFREGVASTEKRSSKAR